MSVEHLLLKENVGMKVLVCDGHYHNGERCVDEVEDNEVNGIDGVGTRESVVDLEPK